MYLTIPGYLMHGTNKPYGVGMRVSHGCIRLYPEDIANLFPQVPVGTKVRIINQPFKAGWLAGKNHSPFLVPADLSRPAAVDQLLKVAASVGVPALESKETRDPVKLAAEGLRDARKRGFDVVAEEIRKLAGRTTEATGEIAAMIGEVQADTLEVATAISESTELAGSAQESIAEIVAGIQAVQAYQG